MDTVEYCFDCARRPRSFVYGRALINYNEAASRSMAQIKYNNRREYLDYYAGEMVRRLGPAVKAMKAQALVPVPVRGRLKTRGFNQAEELARRLSGGLGLPVETGLLSRNKNTAPQKDLSPAQRLKNLEGGIFGKMSPDRTYIRDFGGRYLHHRQHGGGLQQEVLTRAGVSRVYFFVSASEAGALSREAGMRFHAETGER